ARSIVSPPEEQAHDKTQADGADDEGASDRHGKPRENNQSNGDDGACARARHAESAVPANVAWLARARFLLHGRLPPRRLHYLIFCRRSRPVMSLGWGWPRTASIVGAISRRAPP